ncbi:MAG: hypothetical protein HYS86_00980 [Candidatus Chisholmbacteria bacterium]|nr:hypothetical protein [Candidatus Chisholmbacteria bacterium]
MTKFQKKIVGALAGASILVSTLTPAVLAASYEISGNGRDSTSLIETDLERKVDVQQDNDADVKNDVTVYTNTGNNKANDNIGGNVSIDTGNTDVGVQISNNLNTNFAEVDNCGGCAFDGEFKIANNGRDSDNTIEFDAESKVEVDQDNDAKVKNYVDVTAKTGDNDANDNNGGSVEIDTGNVKVNPVAIWNTLNANFARVSNGGGDGELSARIVGNLRKSANLIDLDFESKVDVQQDNDADVANDVDVYGNSGNNDANDNHGSVEIDTGNVEIGVLVDTAANFNLADVEDCCLLDLDAKIGENGRDSDNTIELDLEDKLEVDQDNDLDCDGGHKKRGGWGEWGEWWKKDKGGKCADVDLTAKTGDNDANDNGAGGGDPSIDTGDADVAVEVSNSGNVNEFGDGDFDLPGGGTSVDIDLDFGGLMELLEELLDLLS